MPGTERVRHGHGQPSHLGGLAKSAYGRSCRSEWRVSTAPRPEFGTRRSGYSLVGTTL